MLKLKNVVIQYDEQPLLSLDEICFYKGQLSVINGESGCGKTSLLYILGLISEQKHYHYEYDQRIIKKEKDKEWLRKNNIGYIFQDKNLQDDLTIYQNMDLYSQIAGKKLTHEKANELLKLVDLNLSYNRKIATLSGGEKQRVAIACSLSKDPDIIIADEPTSSLDEENKNNVVSIFKRLAHDLNKTIIVASHDQCFIDAADQLYTIKDQKISHQSFKNIEDFPNQPINKQKIRLSFYFTILKYKFVQYFKSMTHILWMSFLVICISAIALTINQALLDDNYERLNALSPNKVYVSSLVDEETVDFISRIEEVKSIKPYYQLSDIILSNMENKNIEIHNYYTDDILDQYVLETRQEGEAYLNFLFKENFPEEIQFKYLDKDYTFKVKGTLNASYQDIYKTTLPVLYLPTTFFENLEIPTTNYVVEIKDMQDIDSVMQKITNYDASLQVTSEYKNVEGLLTIQENISFFVYIGVFVLCLVALLTVCMSQILEMNSRIYEICIFRANGLQRKNLYKLELLRLGCILLIGNILMDVFGTVILWICQAGLHLDVAVFNTSYYLLVLIMSLTSFLLPVGICLMKIATLTPEKVLRQ